MSKWINVNDRLPENDDDVLCYYESYNSFGEDTIFHYCGIGYYWKEFDKWDGDVTDRPNAKVLYWQPLPEPPKGEQDGQAE